jgi:hypothetical protein
MGVQMKSRQPVDTDPRGVFIRNRAAQFWKYPVDFILLDIRDPRVCEARFAGYWVARQLAGLGVAEIAAAFRRDAGTISTGLARVAELMEDRPEYRERVKAFMAEVGEELHEVEQARRDAYKTIVDRHGWSAAYPAFYPLPPIQPGANGASSAPLPGGDHESIG